MNEMGALYARQIFIIWLCMNVHQNRESDAMPACKISEFPCKNNKCVRLDRFCNGVNDCGDKSDEPLYCTACNRTYYGEISNTYDMELPKPRPDRVPFLCHLTFTANGHSNGDLIQLLFDAFQVGRFDERSYDGCPDGSMQIMELGRPFTGGSWCGASQSLTVYYSETNTITISLRLHHSLALNGFQFKLRYRFLSDDEAIVRFGSVSSPVERGEIVPGTYCSRNFYECYRKKCRLQSPNFPGMYPRNVTCHLSLKQKVLPTCKHAMISISQKNGQRIQIKRSVSVASVNKTRSLRAWNDCSIGHQHRDQLIFYDGPTTDDPVLVRFCGGDWLPPIASRGPEMLVVFRSAAFAAPLDGIATMPALRGFELDVSVVFVDSDSLDFVRESRRCEFWVNASNPDGDEISLRSKGRAGALASPAHTLPPNTTCTWHFHSHVPTDNVWIYFISYSQQPLLPEGSDFTAAGNSSAKIGKIVGTGKRLLVNSTNSCSTRLRIWDGGGKSNLLLGDYCGDNIPRLCDHTSLSNLTRSTRPCTSSESYKSSGNHMLIKLITEGGTALHPVSFRLWYEFIDTRLGGDPYPYPVSSLRLPSAASPVSQSCSRIFRRQRRGLVHSPRNVFLYGKGGATNLSCVYRIEAPSASERVKLTLLNASLGGDVCVTNRDPHTLRPRCVKSRRIFLIVYESPWREIAVPHACFCDNSTNHWEFVSASRSIEIHFVITAFNITEGYTDLYFHATFEIVPRIEEDSCAGVPWWVEARPNSSLFLLTWGSVMQSEPSNEELEKCTTKNRVMVYSGNPLKLEKIICPSKANSRPYAVHIFSEEWLSTNRHLSETIRSSSPITSLYSLPIIHAPSFLVEFIAFEPGSAQVNWLEISRIRSSSLYALHMDLPLAHNSTIVGNIDCSAKCPEIDACISPALWCDGRVNCPSGFDEAESHCGVGHRFISLIPGGLYAVLGAAAAVLTFFCLFVALIVAYNVRKRKAADHHDPYNHHHHQKSLYGKRGLSTDELLLDPSSAS